MTVELTVYGVPGPQGSKRFLGLSKSGRGVIVESSKKVMPWREAVKWAWKAAQLTCIPGSVKVCVVFTVPKPSSAPKRRVTYPGKKPDIDKLIRSTFDALSDVGAWEDDARVVELRSAKRYPDEGDGSLSTPGAVIRIEAI